MSSSFGVIENLSKFGFSSITSFKVIFLGWGLFLKLCFCRCRLLKSISIILDSICQVDNFSRVLGFVLRISFVGVLTWIRIFFSCRCHAKQNFGDINYSWNISEGSILRSNCWDLVWCLNIPQLSLLSVSCSRSLMLMSSCDVFLQNWHIYKHVRYSRSPLVTRQSGIDPWSFPFHECETRRGRKWTTTTTK